MSNNISDNTEQSPIHILIVDDDKMVRNTLKTLIQTMGYRCTVAENGVHAVEILKEKSFELVLSDVVMPQMDGLELLAYVTEQYPLTDVIIATGLSEKASYAEVIKAGAIDFIKKPIEVAELEAKLARAMREREMMRRLEQLSLSDSLTGLLNRRAFDERFSKELDRATRQSYSLYLAFVDIDNFKEYNDTYGHLAGDKVLIELASLLLHCTRKNVDLNFRLGGDEYAVLIPQTTREQAVEIMERVRTSFGKENYGTTSLSTGIIPCTRDTGIPRDRDERSMKNEADKAMYEAKAQGKNRVICR